ncbi:3-carboxymuconate cyclase [Westerdykella ornata]|uniref:3-carboxymuconate cyclase n=1 Tax=Westerdykella ornata TaxID=318751 RepID=A0A6A6J607_WESOR|nr:3-carboxymuconate cyclase [Westerdykella ornata]KAF2271654.1 3-carboxymuconate cyclase [Westerdykella ornata]
MNNLLLAALASSASAVRLFATNYAPPNSALGSITTLDFAPGLGYGDNSATLKPVSANQECGSAPTWLDRTQGGDLIYCVDEGWQTPKASLNTLRISPDGSLKRIAQLDTVQGPVSTQFYNKGAAVAMAHYGGSAITTYKLSADKTTFTPLEVFTFSTPPGPRPEQEASHPHHAVLDPTGRFLIFPDLGSDVVRVYGIDPKTSLLKEHESLKAKPAYGPRHAVFWSPGRKNTNTTTFLFVVNELSNRLTSYRVTYPRDGAGGLGFTELQDVGLYGDRTTPPGSRAAEIAVSPDNEFIVTSNRNATVFTIANPDPKNATKIGSDSLTVFKPAADGRVRFVQLAPSGGSFPRHFSFNRDGTLVAVGNQNSFTVDIWRRNPRSGKLGERVASAVGLPGQVNNVVWDEK